MAAEWYYLDNGNETGPVGGSQLKKLADAGIVFPWTPVKRVSGSDVSPWTRAGTIQGMFAGDVREQLGGPICDDCGHTLENGNCPKCSPVVETATAAPNPWDEPPPAIDTPSPAPQVRRPAFDDRLKYRNLRSYCNLLGLASWVALAVGALWILFAFVPILSRLRIIGIANAVGMLAAASIPGLLCLLAYVLLNAAAEVFHVLMGIEENSRRTAHFTEHGR